MLTYYCPNCWISIDKSDKKCPGCGYAIEDFNQLTFEDKLLASLHHSVPERQIMAAQILGNLKSERALVEFRKIIESKENNYFLLRAILLATVKINQPARDIILKIASQHSSILVSDLAKELIAQLSNNMDFKEWDRNTG
jgi:hypothetical protein